MSGARRRRAREQRLAPDLALIGGAAFRRRADRLAVRDAGFSESEPDPELAFDPLQCDVEVKLSHPRQERLAGFGIDRSSQGRIFALQAGDEFGEAVAVAARFRFDGDRNDGRRESDGLEQDRLSLGAQRVAADGPVQSRHRDDVTGFGDGHGLAAIGEHAQHPTKTLTLSGARIPRPLARFEASGVNAQVKKVGGRVGLDFEDERRKRRGVDRRPHDRLAVARIGARSVTDVRRRREVPADRVEERLDADVAQRRAAQNRHRLARDGHGAQRGAQVGGRDRLLGQEKIGQRLVKLGEALDQAGPPRLA